MRLAASACLLALALSAAAAAAASQPGACPLDSGLGALSEATVQKFIDSLDGTAIFRGQTQFGKAANLTTTSNVMFNSEREPLLVVQAASEADVAAAVRLAADARLPICPRAGGHDSAGFSLCDGLVLDLKRLNSVDVFDKGAASEVAIGAGAQFERIIGTLKGHGLEAVTGSCATVGIAGFSLGGGWGWRSKGHGLGVDNVLSYRVVLADGSIVDATADGPHAELFWGLRGGGHNNLGVVTALRYRAFPTARVPTANVTFDAGAHPDRAAAALQLWGDKYLDGSEGGQGIPALVIHPQFWGDRGTGSQRLVMYAALYEGDEARLRALMKPFEELGAVESAYESIDAVHVPAMPDVLFEDMFAAEPPAGAARWEAKLCEYSALPLGRQQWQAIVDGWLTWPAYPQGYPAQQAWTYSYLEGMEGKVTKAAADDTAFVHRAPGFDLVVHSYYMNVEGAKEAVHAWQKGLYGDRWEGLLTGGSYANCPSDTYGAEEAVRKYYGSNLCRLVAAKRTYDPSNLFAYEQGVPLQAAECDE